MNIPLKLNDIKKMLDSAQADKDGKWEAPAMQVLMQLDTPPCFKQEKLAKIFELH